MKKNLIKMMLAAVVVVASGVNIYNSQKENGMSDVVLANVDALASDDEIIIRLSQIDGKIKISIINHGEMIKEENQSKIFEQGYTTKTDGWGVGLSVCQKFIGSQFGTFELAKSDERETEFSILIPLV